MTLYSAVYESPLGRITLVGDGEGLSGLWLEGQEHYLGTLKECPARDDTLAVLRQAEKWLDRYFAGERPTPQELRFRLTGSVFRRTVWKCLCEIPYGETTTYGALAKKTARLLGRKNMAAQAVGGAVGHNPISIVIPCHRVVGADGSLTGYAGGLERKRRLLEFERDGGMWIQESGVRCGEKGMG